MIPIDRNARGKPYLLGIDDVHNHATLQHLGETSLDGEVIAGGTVLGHCESCKGRN